VQELWTFYGDNSGMKQYVQFPEDPQFINSREFTYSDAPTVVVQPIRAMNIDWHLHIATQAASQCLHLDGGFIECCAWWGWLSTSMFHRTNFGSSNKSCHLFDSRGAEGFYDNY
jgi:hypothetical protein